MSVQHEKGALMDLAPLIDHTLLMPDASEEDVRLAIDEAKRLGCASVCVRPPWVPLAAELLAGTSVGVTTVIGFPEGTGSVSSKVSEAAEAVLHGATELDLVINYQSLQQGLYGAVKGEIQAVRAAAPNRILKVILETAVLTDEEIAVGCRLASDAGADYVKTSTGYHPAGGATLHAVAIMVREVPHMGVKASGGIRTYEEAQAFIDAGATRLGISAAASTSIVEGRDY